MKTKTEKKKEERKETPRKCVCGKRAYMVKHKGKYMYACIDIMNCAMRSRWCSSEESAIKSWNAIIDEERHRRA